MIIIAIISIIIYTVAIVSIYYNINQFDNKQKLIYIIVGIILVLILTSVLSNIISMQINIGTSEQKNITKITSILIFSPINCIITLPIVGNTLSKYKEEVIDYTKMKKRFILCGILLIILIIVEFGYIKNFQIGLLSNRG